jgi:hypothetical protein
VVFRPTAPNAYTGTLTINASTPVTGSPVPLTGTGFVPVKPALSVLDNFNRANATNLGANWTQTGGAVAGIRVNSNQAFCTGILCLLGANAYWSPAAFGAKQGVAVQIANTPVTNKALILAATGTPVLSVYPNSIRVQVSGSTATVATTTNGGLTYTTAGSVTGPSAFANGDTVTAVLDGTNAVAAPTVYVWRTTTANVTTFVGAVQLPVNSLWQSGGQIGVQMLSGARADNFAGGTVP